MTTRSEQRSTDYQLVLLESNGVLITANQCKPAQTITDCCTNLKPSRARCSLTRTKKPPRRAIQRATPNQTVLLGVAYDWTSHYAPCDTAFTLNFIDVKNEIILLLETYHACSIAQHWKDVDDVEDLSNLLSDVSQNEV